eukprot:5516668-Pleurochrysis_carterae.AAC.1
MGQTMALQLAPAVENGQRGKGRRGVCVGGYGCEASVSVRGPFRGASAGGRLRGRASAAVVINRRRAAHRNAGEQCLT